ncbi:MAG: dockerin type I repeat-containing protein [Armatimonadota bacterium]
MRPVWIACLCLASLGLCALRGDARPAPNEVVLRGPVSVRAGDDAAFVVLAPSGLWEARTLVLYPMLTPRDTGAEEPWVVGLTIDPSLRQRVSVISPTERSFILAPPLTEHEPTVLAYLVVHVPASASEGSTPVVSLRYAVLSLPSADGLDQLVEWAQGTGWPDVSLPGLLSYGEASASTEISQLPAGFDLDCAAWTADYLVRPGAVVSVPVRLGKYVRRTATYAFVRLTAAPVLPNGEPLTVASVAKPLLPTAVVSVIADAPTDPTPGAVSVTVELVSESSLWPADPAVTAALQLPPISAEGSYQLRVSACFATRDGSVIESCTRNGTIVIDPYRRLVSRDSIQYGDVDGDGEITVADSAAVVRRVLGLSQFGPDELIAADVWPFLPTAVGDRRVSLEDVREILRRALGIWSGG